MRFSWICGLISILYKVSIHKLFKENNISMTLTFRVFWKFLQPFLPTHAWLLLPHLYLLLCCLLMQGLVRAHLILHPMKEPSHHVLHKGIPCFRGFDGSVGVPLQSWYQAMIWTKITLKVTSCINAIYIYAELKCFTAHIVLNGETRYLASTDELRKAGVVTHRKLGVLVCLGCNSCYLPNDMVGHVKQQHGVKIQDSHSFFQECK